MQDAITQTEPSLAFVHISIRRTAASHQYSINSVGLLIIVVICLVFASFAKRRTVIGSRSYPMNRERWFL